MLEKKIFISSVVFLGMLLASYGFFVAYNFWSGPSITLIEGANVTTTSEDVLSYTFLIENASGIYFQGEAIQVNQDMIFEKTIYPLEGLNYYEIVAQNFGDSVKETVVIYKK